MKPLELFALSLLLLTRLSAADCSDPRAGDFAAASDFAALAEDVYREDGGLGANGWKPIDHGSSWTGLQWTLYQKGDEVVLSFRGTDTDKGKIELFMDGMSNLANAMAPVLMDAYSPQYMQALEIAATVKATYTGKLSLTGHSLGGGLAAYAADRLDLPAHVFNPAPINNALLARNPMQKVLPDARPTQRIINHIHENDVLHQAYGVEDKKVRGLKSLVDVPGVIWDSVRYTLDKPLAVLLSGASRVGEDFFIGEKDVKTNHMIDAHSVRHFREYYNGFRDCFPDTYPPVVSVLPMPPITPPAGGGSLGPGGSSGSSGGGVRLKPFR